MEHDYRAALSELVKAIHDKWERYETYALKDFDTPKRNQFFGATDALWDMDDALRGVWNGLPANAQLAKLAAYGTLQALVTQQDAVQSLCEVVLPERPWVATQVIELQEIRVLRHRLSGHVAFAKYSGRTASIIDVRDRQMIAGTIYGLQGNDVTERFPCIPIRELILTNSKLLASALKPIDNAMNNPAAVFDRLRKEANGA